MKRFLFNLVAVPWRHHAVGSLVIVLIIAAVISGQIANRHTFANSELHADVMERWGAPIDQPVPSALFVESGTVFNRLHPLPFDLQRVGVRMSMNYRKRGLIYFSGFDFAFSGDYQIRNDRAHDIDVAFVFPINMEKNQVLLKDLSFSVNGEPQSIRLDNSEDRLVWTGRLRPEEEAAFSIAFRGRGLDRFTYTLNPELPVRGFELTIQVSGGDNIDYAPGVVPATTESRSGEEVVLGWQYASLESGIPVGVTLPSESSFDEIIATMLRRAWAPFMLFFMGVTGLSLLFGRRLLFYEAYLVSASYGLFFVLVAYLAAFTHFYVAYVLASLTIGAMLSLYLRRLLGHRAWAPAVGLVFSFLIVPTLAVIMEGYTGLIYTLEILFGLVALMVLSSQHLFADLVSRLLQAPAEKEESHAA